VDESSFNLPIWHTVVDIVVLSGFQCSKATAINRFGEVVGVGGEFRKYREFLISFV